jgi:RNA polymerase sigma-70 factor, ECF subfamily
VLGILYQILPRGPCFPLRFKVIFAVSSRFGALSCAARCERLLTMPIWLPPVLADAEVDVSQDENRLPPEALPTLIQRVRRGEVDLFSKLVQPHEKSLRLTCYSILQNDADAEEVVQETMLKALAHLDQLHDDQCFRGWLYQIAINEARRRLRKDRIYERTAGDREESASEQGEFIPRDFADWTHVPSQEMERKELWGAVSRALRSMASMYREVFVLRDMQHLTTSQAAMVLGISEASVNTRLHRARLQMREQLAPFFHPSEKQWVPAQKIMDAAVRYMRKAMGCDRIVHELSNYIEGQLEPSLRREIERHLRRCSLCSILVDSTRKLLYLVGDARIFPQPFVGNQNLPHLLARTEETSSS